MRHAKYVTKEMQVTVANVLVYKEGGETEERQIELAGYHDNVDILGHKFYDGAIVVQVKHVEQVMKCYRMPIADFIANAEEYVKDRRNSRNEEDE